MSQSKTKLIIFSITLILVFVLTCIFATPAHAYPTEEQQQILAEIEQYQVKLDELSNDYNEAILKGEEAEKQISKLQKEIKVTEQKIISNQGKLKTQAINIYKHGDIPYTEVLLNTQSFDSFVTNLKYSNSFVNQTNDLIAEQQNLKSQLQTDIKEQQQLKKEAEEAATAAQEAMDEANATIVDLENRYMEIDAELAAAYTYSEEVYIPDYSNADTSTAAYSYSYDGNSSVVERAYSKIGCPYSWGGTTSAGFDCSGFVSYCLTGQEGTRLGTTGTFSG